MGNTNKKDYDVIIYAVERENVVSTDHLNLGLDLNILESLWISKENPPLNEYSNSKDIEFLIWTTNHYFNSYKYLSPPYISWIRFLSFDRFDLVNNCSFSLRSLASHGTHLAAQTFVPGILLILWLLIF